MADKPPLRASKKASDAMRTIGEVSADLGVKPHILRYWEAQFDMLQPLKRAGGRRYYRAQDVAMLRNIDHLLNQQGYTMRGARQHLAARQTVGTPPNFASNQSENIAGSVTPAAAAPTQTPEHMPDLAALRAIRDRLATAIAAAE